MASEGPDADAIDMDVVRDGDRMFVNCQLRNEVEIGVEALREMQAIVARNGADGAFLLTDGDFSAPARDYAAQVGLVLVAGDQLVDLVVELTLGQEKDRKAAPRRGRRLRLPGRKKGS
jgi:restriction system protein